MNLKNQIYCGDNSELIKQVPDNSIDLTVTSPPYDNLREYQGYDWDFETLAKELYRVTKEGGVVVWVVNDSTVDGSESLTSCKQKIFFREECGFKIQTMFLGGVGWSPPYPNLKRYPKIVEYVFILSKGKIKTFNPLKDRKTNCAGESGGFMTQRQQNGNVKKSKTGFTVRKFSIRPNIWFYDKGFLKGSKDKIAYKHPAIFPDALARDHVLSWSNPGDIVFDPFTGSGTTLKMAMQCNRYYLGFEISQEYIDIANERLRQKCLFN